MRIKVKLSKGIAKIKLPPKITVEDLMAIQDKLYDHPVLDGIKIEGLYDEDTDKELSGNQIS